jgi:hypothetical protein
MEHVHCSGRVIERVIEEVIEDTRKNIPVLLTPGIKITIGSPVILLPRQKRD